MFNVSFYRNLAFKARDFSLVNGKLERKKNRIIFLLLCGGEKEENERGKKKFLKSRLFNKSVCCQ